MIKRRQEGLRKCQVKIDRNGRRTRMRMRVDIIIMQKKEKGKDSEKRAKPERNVFTHKFIFMFIYKKRKVPKMDIGPPYHS